MEALLKESGKSFYGLRRQTFSLLLSSTLMYVNVMVIFGLIDEDTVVTPGSIEEKIAKDENETDELIVMPAGRYLIYENPWISLSSEHLARGVLQAAFFVGILLGYCFSWFIFSSLRPKIILLTVVSLNALLVFFSSFIPYYWLFVGARLGVGLIAAIGQTSIALLFLDWSHATNQAMAIHFMFSTRALAVFIVAIALWIGLIWRQLFFVYFGSLLIAGILVFIFVNESPRWLRKNGKLSQFSVTLVDFGKKLGITISGEDVFADDLESQDPQKRSPMPTPGEITILTGVYMINALASLVLQGSTGFYLSWTTEIFLLALIYFSASIVTAPLYNSAKTFLFISTSLALIITIILMFIGNGILYGTLLQGSKLVSAITDHFALFLMFATCSPKKGQRWPGITQREWRARILLGIETAATMSRCLAVFFVLQKSDAISLQDRVPKLLICTVCYFLTLALLILAHFLCKRPSSSSAPSNPDDEEAHEPFIPPIGPGDKEPLPPPSTINPPPPRLPPTEIEPDDIDIDSDDDVDIDI